MIMTIDKALQDMVELSTWALKMRRIMDNPNIPSGTRYQAAVTEDHHIELMQRYIKYINDVKEQNATWTPQPQKK